MMKRIYLLVLIIFMGAFSVRAQVARVDQVHGTGAPTTCLQGEIYTDDATGNLYSFKTGAVGNCILSGNTASGSGTVTNVTGTTNQINVATGSTTPALSLSSTIIAPGTLRVTTSITDDGLTSGRVPIAGVGGLLGDDADLTFLTDTLTVTKIVGSTSVKSPLLLVGTATGSNAVIDVAVNGGGAGQGISMQNTGTTSGDDTQITYITNGNRTFSEGIDRSTSLFTFTPNSVTLGGAGSSTVDPITGAWVVPNSFTIGAGAAITSSGAGGALGTNAFTSTAYAPVASPTFTGTVTIPTPFTLGAISVTTTGTQLNYLSSATGTTGTASANVVFSASPTLTGTVALPTGITVNGNAMTFPTTAQTIPGMNQTNTAGSSYILDVSAASVTAGLKIPSAAGAVPTADGFIATNTTNHTHVWGSNGTTMVGAIAATGTGTATTCTNQFVSVISSLAVPTCTTVTLAGAQFANQGTTTTVLHGNASGNPSFGAVALSTDVSGTLQAAQEPAHTGDVTNSAGSLALSIAANAVTLAKLATQATNTVLGNATSGTAVPTALTVGTCSAAGSALIWTTNTGFGCNTSITAAAVPASGLTGATLAAGVTASSLTSLGTLSSLSVTKDSNAVTLAASTGTNPTWIQASNTSGNYYLAIESSVGGTTFTGSTAYATMIGNTVAKPIEFFVNGAKTVAFASGGGVNMPSLATSSAATTGTVCWTTGTGLLNVDTTTTCLLSSAKYKKNERPLTGGLNTVLRLRPISYFLKDDPYHVGEQEGFFAEDVAKIDRRLVSFELDGSPHAVRYQQMSGQFALAIQQLNAKVERLENEKTITRHRSVRRHARAN